MANSSIPQASPSPPTTTSSLLTVNNARIQKFAMDGSFVAAVGSKGNGKGSFDRPQNIVVHPSGQVLVADQDNHRVQVLNHNLSFSHSFGSCGSQPGQFITSIRHVH